LRRPRWWSPIPQLVGQPVGGDDGAGVHEQDRQESTQLSALDQDVAAAARDLKWPKNPEVHPDHDPIRHQRDRSTVAIPLRRLHRFV
jgi:hypothetical protein